MAFIQYNPNPGNYRVGDCTIRALSRALDLPWEKIYVDLAIQGLFMCDMPSANSVWGAYLKTKGFKRDIVPDCLCDTYSVSEFAKDNPTGVYILALSGHVVCVYDGNYYDTWDSGDEVPLYYWHKEEN